MSDKEQFDPSEAMAPDTQPRVARMVLAHPGEDADERLSLRARRRSGSHGDALYPLRVVYKRRWLVGSVLVLTIIGAFVYSFTQIPVYEASVRVLIENDRLNLVKIQDVRDQDVTSQAYYQTQFIILQSRSLARKTISTLRQAGQFDATPAEVVPPPLTVGSALSNVKRFLTGSPQPPQAQPQPDVAPTPPAAAAAPTDGEVDAFLSGLTISPVPNSRLMDVRYRSTVPALTARYANALVAEYINQNMESKFMATKEAADWLANRLTDQRQKVEVAETALQKFRERTGVVAPNPADDPTVQRLDGIATALTNARAVRIEKEALYRQAQAVKQNQAAVDSLPAVVSNAYVQQVKSELAGLQTKLGQLTQDYGEKMPEVVSTRRQIAAAENKLKLEVDKVIESLRAEYVASQASENSLNGAFESQKRQVIAMNKTGLDYAILQREAESHRQIYEMLTQRAKETDLAGEIKSNTVRIIDPAELPRRARGGNRMSTMRTAAMWGLVVAVGFAFLLEYIDSRIKTPDEFAALCDVPLLGILPADAENGDKGPLLCAEPHGHYAEALRGVRTNVIFSGFAPGSRSLLVTSAGKGEGKTAVATNLAISIAQMGSRVLLIDADMRRPRVHTIFDRPVSPGLSDLLAGTSKGNEIVLPSGVSGLWFVAAGTTPPNPAELLGSDRFKKLLRYVEERFDWVVIDSPPVLPVTDGALMAHEASAVLFVVSAGTTTRHAVLTSLSTLGSVDGRVIGAVLNRLDVVRNPYYYQPEYRKSYGYYARASNG